MENNSELPQIKEVEYRQIAKQLSARLGRRITIRDMYNWLVILRHPLPEDVRNELTAIVAEAASPNQGDTDNGNYSRFDR